MPKPERDAGTAGTSRRPKRLRCESCLDVLSLRHAWEVRACSCGALLLSGRPARPSVHWLSRPGGGWTETDDDLDFSASEDSAPERPAPEGAGEQGRRLGFSPSAW